MRNVTGVGPKQIVFKNGILLTQQKLFENIRGHDFYRGMELTIDLMNLERAYEVSCIENKFICFVICELCETGQFKWTDYDVDDVSVQFRNQWNTKIIGCGNIGQYIHSWNYNTPVSFEEFTRQRGYSFGTSSIVQYRTWMFEQLTPEFGDVEFTFRVMADDLED